MEASTAQHPTRLAEILDQEGRRQKWLADATDINESVMSQYVRGMHVPDDRREAIAKALRRTVADIFETEIGAPV